MAVREGLKARRFPPPRPDPDEGIPQCRCFLLPSDGAKPGPAAGGFGSWGTCFGLGKLPRILNCGDQLTRRRLSIPQAAE